MDEYSADFQNQEIYEVQELKSEYNDKKYFTTLVAWIKCKNLKLFCYNKIIPLLPPEEKYNLNNQIRRAAVSITANIAEGYGRIHYKEGIQFYRISRGSLYELKDHLISCYDFKFISSQLYDEGIKLIEEAKKTLNGYINYIRHQVK